MADTQLDTLFPAGTISLSVTLRLSFVAGQAAKTTQQYIIIIVAVHVVCMGTPLCASAMQMTAQQLTKNTQGVYANIALDG